MDIIGYVLVLTNDAEEATRRIYEGLPEVFAVGQYPYVSGVFDYLEVFHGYVELRLPSGATSILPYSNEDQIQKQRFRLISLVLGPSDCYNHPP